MTMISDLPQDLVETILSRLPITSLGTVRSTCKAWNVLSNNMVLCKADIMLQFTGFMMKEYRICSMRFDLHGILNKESEEFVGPSIKEIDNLFNQVEISNIIHCDGLLLCVTKEDDTRGLVVWNPYLGQTRWIQPKNHYHRLDRYALGYEYDNKKHNHKILRFCRNHVFGYEIYNFNSNSWKVLDIIPDRSIGSYQRCVTLKGNTYFLAKEKIMIEEGEIDEPHDFLLCFDFTRERFGQFLPLPFQHYDDDDTGTLSSLRDEKLAALYQREYTTEVEIWVTTKIEPDAVSWVPFLRVNMEALGLRGASFFIEEEKKLAVVFDLDQVYNMAKTRCSQTAYIIGENGYLQKVDLGEAVNRHATFLQDQFCHPLVCSYVPNLVQIN